MSAKLREILGFSVIETIVMVGWLHFALTAHPFLAIGILFVGLIVEHVTAYNTGANRSFFSLPN